MSKEKLAKNEIRLRFVLNTEHGGCDRMLKELLIKYQNVTRHDVELMIHFKESCQNKRKKKN